MQLSEPTPTPPPELARGPRTAVVTGGAGGIGQAICRQLAGDGYAVVVADVDQTAAEKLAGELPSVSAGEHCGFAGDLTESAVTRELAAFAGGIAPIGVVVNALGISPKQDGQKIRFFDLSDELWNRVMAVNLTAPFYLMREAYQHMPHDGTASVVNLLSITARTGSGAPADAHFGPFIPSTVAYGASKAGVCPEFGCQDRKSVV